MRTKYIVIIDSGLENAIVFPEIIDHAKIAGDNKVVSAGFVQFSCNEDRIESSCYGESTTLKIKSRGKEDEILIDKYILGYSNY